MSTPIDKIGLSGPALGALRKAKVKTLEAAAAMSDEELLAIPRFGPKGLATVRGAEPWQPGGPGTSFVDDPDGGQDEKPGSANPRRLSGLMYDEMAAFNARVRAGFAEAILMKLLERLTPSPAVVTLAWDLALAFDQDRGRGALLHDGMRVTFNGQKCVLRTSFKAGEAQPAADRVVAKALLVKADG